MNQINSIIESAPLLPVLGLLLAGLLQCFLGYRFLKFWITIAGFGVGLVLGYIVSSLIIRETGGETYIPVIIGLAAGLVFGFLAYKVYLAGVFIFCGLMAFGAAAAFTFPEGRGWDIFAFVVRVVVFLIAGYVGMKFARPAVILISAFAGSSQVLRALPTFVTALRSDQELRMLIFVLLAAVGIVVQWITTSGDK